MLVPLRPGDEHLILDHYVRLSTDDRYLRFFSPMSDYALGVFVNERMDLVDGVAFGVLVDGSLVGVGYVGKTYVQDGRDTAEAGFSIDAEHRGHGYATMLMSAIIGYCRGARIQTLVMCCLRENQAMRQIASNFGLRVVIEQDEAYADLSVHQPTFVEP